MRFMLAPNMVGLPAITIPVGAVTAPASGPGGTARGSVALPVGLQLMAPAWHEASLLAAAAALEAALREEGTLPLRPPVLYDILAPPPPAAAAAK